MTDSLKSIVARVCLNAATEAIVIEPLGENVEIVHRETMWAQIRVRQTNGMPRYFVLKLTEQI